MRRSERGFPMSGTGCHQDRRDPLGGTSSSSTPHPPPGERSERPLPVATTTSCEPPTLRGLQAGSRVQPRAGLDVLFRRARVLDAHEGVAARPSARERFASVVDELADHADPDLALELGQRLRPFGDGGLQQVVEAGDVLEAFRTDHTFEAIRDVPRTPDRPRLFASTRRRRAPRPWSHAAEGCPRTHYRLVVYSRHWLTPVRQPALRRSLTASGCTMRSRAAERPHPLPGGGAFVRLPGFARWGRHRALRVLGDHDLDRAGSAAGVPGADAGRGGHHWEVQHCGAPRAGAGTGIRTHPATSADRSSRRRGFESVPGCWRTLRRTGRRTPVVATDAQPAAAGRSGVSAAARRLTRHAARS